MGCEEGQYILQHGGQIYNWSVRIKWNYPRKTESSRETRPSSDKAQLAMVLGLTERGL